MGGCLTRAPVISPNALSLFTLLRNRTTTLLDPSQRPHLAALVQLYIDLGAPLEANSGQGSPLHLAVCLGLTDVVELMLQCGAIVDEPVFDSPLFQQGNHLFSATDAVSLDATALVLQRAVELWPSRANDLLLILCSGRCELVQRGVAHWERLLDVVREGGANVACRLGNTTPYNVACHPRVAAWLAQHGGAK